MQWGKNLETITGFHIDKEKLKVIQDFMFSGFHILLTGHPGCGKTYFGQAWATAFGMEFHKVNCGAIRSPREWFGRWEYREGKGTLFIPSKFVQMLEKPSLIILDEINRTTPDNHNPILNILDDNREVFVEELNRNVQVHEQTVFIATANKGRQHYGTFQMDDAFEDRFQEIKLYLPPQDVIARMLQEQYGIPPEKAESIAKITLKLNDLYDEDLLTRTMGMRPALAAASLIAKGNPMKTALEYSFITHFPAGGPNSEQTLVKQTIQGLVSLNVLD